MLELLLCSAVTILPDFLYRRFVQGKRIGREITLFSVWYELRWGITLCLILTVLADHHDLLLPPLDLERGLGVPHRHHPARDQRPGRRDLRQHQPGVAQGQPLFRLDSTEHEAAIETAKRRIAEVDATVQVATAQLAEADGQIAHARGALQQALDEFGVRAELRAAQPGRHPAARRRPGAGAGRHPAGPRRRRARRQGGAVRPRSTSSCRRRRRAPRLRCARRGRARQDHSSSPAPTASSSSSRSGPATSSTRCCARRHPRSPTATPPGWSSRLRPDRGAGDQGRHGRRGRLHRPALHGRPDGDHRRAGRVASGQVRPTDQLHDVAAAGPRHYHRRSSSRSSRAPSTACRRAAPASPTPTPPTTTRSRTRRSAPSTPSSCTRSTRPASSTPRSSGCRR